MKKSYYNHRIVGSSRNEVGLALQAQPTNPDRAYMNNQMSPHIDFLDKHGVNDYPSFIQSFHDYGFKAKDQLDIIIGFPKYMKVNYSKDVFLLKNRELKKTNKGEKNVLIVRVACEFPIEFFNFVQIYIQEKFPQMLNREMLFKDIQFKINQLTNQNECDMISILDESTNQDQVDQLDSPFDDDQFGFFLEGSALLTEL